MIRWNLFFEVEKVEQLALIDPLATHHDRPPSLKASGNRNHDSSIFTRPFSTGSAMSGHHGACGMIAVGTRVASRPPLRSVVPNSSIRLPPRVSDSEACIWPGMED